MARTKALKKRVRLEEREANRLHSILADEPIIARDGSEGRVTAITKGGIQVLFSGTRSTRPYPLYDSFVKGELRFRSKGCQEEMLHSLYEAARAAGVATPPEIEQASKEPSTPVVSQVDVPGNVRLILFFKNVSEERYLFHMKHVGIAGFEGSVAEGFEKSPFVGLRETEQYLGCSLGLLLSSFEEFLRRIFEECATAKQWGWSEPKSDRLEDGRPHLSVWCKNQDDKRSFIVHAVYEDESMRRCQVMQANFMERRRESFELHTMQFGVLEPDADTVQGFEDAYKRGGGKFAKSISTVSKQAVSGAPSMMRAGATRTAATTPTAKVSASVSSGRQTKPIHVNEFLVRRSYGSHRTGGHRLDPIRATVSVLPKSGGDPYPVEFDAYWCPKCRKYFMGEGTYLNLKRKGYICCKVIEEKDLGTKRAGDGLYGNLASESILHMYGYTVNQQDDLSEAERRTIISFVIENRIQSAQDIAHLLEWLIAQREGNPRMSVAVSRWRTDLRFVKRYHKPTRRVRVDRIYAKI